MDDKQNYIVVNSQDSYRFDINEDDDADVIEIKHGIFQGFNQQPHNLKINSYSLDVSKMKVHQNVNKVDEFEIISDSQLFNSLSDEKVNLVKELIEALIPKCKRSLSRRIIERITKKVVTRHNEINDQHTLLDLCMDIISKRNGLDNDNNCNRNKKQSCNVNDHTNGDFDEDNINSSPVHITHMNNSRFNSLSPHNKFMKLSNDACSDICHENDPIYLDYRSNNLSKTPRSSYQTSSDVLIISDSKKRHCQDTVDIDMPLSSSSSMMNHHKEHYSNSSLDPIVVDDFQSQYQQKSSTSSSDSLLKRITDIFPFANQNYVNELMTKFESNYQLIVTHMIEHGYTKDNPIVNQKETDKEIDFSSSSSWTTSSSYQQDALLALQSDFPFLYPRNLQSFFHTKCHSHYYETVLSLHKLLNIEPGQVQKSLTSVQRKKLKQHGLKSRRPVKIQNEIVFTDEVFLKELEWIKSKRRMEREELDRSAAEEVTRKIAEAEGNMIECGCCCVENPFEWNVQCSEGHLFCRDCLRRYVEESIFGNGKAQLKCMDSTGGTCPGRFPDYMLKLALPSKVYEKYEEQLAKEALEKAALKDLVICCNCQFKAELPEGAGIILRCPKCYKETCRKCGEESHIPLRCEEVEKKEHTDARLTVEEAMTNARLRQCHSCKARFFKTEGCNKMSCTCGKYICYCCRKDISKEMYRHFCQIPHCKHDNCGKCVLYSDALEDDRRAMYDAGIKTAAEVSLKQQQSSTSASNNTSTSLPTDLEQNVMQYLEEGKSRMPGQPARAVIQRPQEVVLNRIAAPNSRTNRALKRARR